MTGYRILGQRLFSARVQAIPQLIEEYPMDKNVLQAQREVCSRFGAEFFESPAHRQCESSVDGNFASLGYCFENALSEPIPSIAI